MTFSIPLAEELIDLAIREDIGDGDHTSLATIPDNIQGKTKLLIKEAGVLAGMEVARLVFKRINPDIAFTAFMEDGTKVMPGDIAFEVRGDVKSMLTAERLVLNFMQRMSGIATQTNRLVSLVSDLPVSLLDTRKTTPNMRLFEKMAVRIGGGYNHRFGLFDMILIKNNHVDFAGSVSNAVVQAQNYLKKTGRRLGIEVEVRNLDELSEVMRIGGIQRIMLDNFSPDEMRRAVSLIGNRFETEASGGITEATLRAYAETGVDFISIGALTHHIRSLDMSLRAVT
ncbi:MAG: carboxylating nicotinate-nucleotide diphosphorylase [Bacteroidetes bacterium]|nr:carboxylating nicotinate-nucleotide diphosphorylase [Bacteroidales bacterium]MBU1011302.1 carboxylating nicotinate-nucleotide diphosphorylase [Bacteroidota bacterium]